MAQDICRLVEIQLMAKHSSATYSWSLEAHNYVLQWDEISYKEASIYSCPNILIWIVHLYQLKMGKIQISKDNQKEFQHIM